MSTVALGAPATENFNSLGTTGGTTATLPQGWKFAESPANSSYIAGTGTSTTGDTYNFGAASSATDRSFGSLSSNSVVSTIGATYVLAADADSIAISFTGKQFRDGGGNSSVVDRLWFYYSTTTTSLTVPSGTLSPNAVAPGTAPTSANTPGLDAYTAVTALNYISQANGTSAAATTSTLPISSTITGLNLRAGDLFTLQWVDQNISGTDDSMAVDDFSITALSGGLDVGISAAPEPATATLCMLGASLVLSRRRGRSGGKG